MLLAVALAAACDRPLAPWVTRWEPDGVLTLPSRPAPEEGDDDVLRGWLRLLERDALAVSPACAVDQTPETLAALGALARVWAFLADGAPVPPATAEAFDSAKAALLTALPVEAGPLRGALARASLADIGALEPALAPEAVVGALAAAGVGVNRALVEVNRLPEELRRAVRRVQPAAVRILAGKAVGSGVNLAADGRVLTAAHVVGKLGARVTVEFPDGSRYQGDVVAFDERADTARIALRGAAFLPTASLAPAPPRPGAPVAVVGQPASISPEGADRSYRPFHVSWGHIVAVEPDTTRDQRLGGVTHDAWTYWGHSGSPLFDAQGRVVALHNSWNEGDGTRHAVPWERLREPLAQTPG